MALDAPGGPTTAFRRVHARATRTSPGEPAVRHITRRIEFYLLCPWQLT
jgi:hypothetical protein